MGKQPTDHPTIATMYDFDKTLSTKDMQEFTFIPKVKMNPSDFWKGANKLTKENKMDGILAYMYQMIFKAKSEHVPIKRGAFVDLGKDVEFYQGVETWFDRITTYGKMLDIDIEHYIISSGLREIIEGTRIYSKFKEVFACEYFYDENDVAVWPKNVVNYTTKTQFVFRINKGVLDISDDNSLNKYTPDENRPVPFRNMIYIGDGLTDVPCMKLVKVNGGYSIAVYQEKQKAEDLIRDGRVNFIAKADYQENSELDTFVRDIISKMAMEDNLKRRSEEQYKESKQT
ncbi:MAG: haloacid dehalogenase-like hydrolase [Oscillospiraceae bacterium]|jgi:2-hydroxy-3-keto-5-methylthiopentenyl-1-phosphate phosphatase|nr:haloacid dehalogenase-like hydrolase [Oscillospiraceae bacterium]